MRPSITALALLLAMGAASLQAAEPGYLRAQGRYIGNDTGLVQMRGLGLGGWLLQEGYMINTDGFAGPQHVVQAKLASLVGPARMEAFYQGWRDNFITKADIDSLAKWGFNSVRLPMHWNLYMDSTVPVKWKDEGFLRTDSLISWCKANRMWVFLDLHAAPGGQGGDYNISDGDPAKPSLWDSPDNQTLAVALWGKLAERYKNEPWVGGYDLLNETNWGFDGDANGCSESSSGNGPLQVLLNNMIAAVRAVDTNHLVILSGNCWGNSYTGFEAQTDKNYAFSFHKYWNVPDSASLVQFLKLRAKNAPLWMSEAGENGNDWFKKTIRLLERQKIGWSWWPYKKIGSTVGPLSVSSTKGWDAFRAWGTGGAMPDTAMLGKGLDSLVDNLRLSRCRIQYDVLDAMFRQVRSDSTKPWRDIHLPGEFGAEEYDLGGDGFAYHDSVSMNVKGPGPNSWNTGATYRNDGVDVVWFPSENSYGVSWVFANEWLGYTVVVDSTAAYSITARTSGTAGSVEVRVDTALVSNLVPVPTGSFSVWTDSRSGVFNLTKGRHFLQLKATKGNFQWGRIKVQIAGTIGVQPRSSASVHRRVEWSKTGLRSMVDHPVEIRITTLQGKSLLRKRLEAREELPASLLPAKGLFGMEVDGRLEWITRL